jgi:hypothetical protein
MEQQVYKGKYGSERATAQQQALLEKMGVQQPIIDSLNREQAFQLIRQIMVKYYEEQTRKRFNGKIVVKW